MKKLLLVMLLVPIVLLSACKYMLPPGSLERNSEDDEITTYYFIMLDSTSSPRTLFRAKNEHTFKIHKFSDYFQSLGSDIYYCVSKPMLHYAYYSDSTVEEIKRCEWYDKKTGGIPSKYIDADVFRVLIKYHMYRLDPIYNDSLSKDEIKVRILNQKLHPYLEPIDE